MNNQKRQSGLVSYNPDHACQLLEMSINCTQTINAECAKDAIFAERMFLPRRLIMYTGRFYQLDSCFYERFDQLFNQDGMCSFQDIME